MLEPPLGPDAWSFQAYSAGEFGDGHPLETPTASARKAEAARPCKPTLNVPNRKSLLHGPLRSPLLLLSFVDLLLLLGSMGQKGRGLRGLGPQEISTSINITNARGR